MKILVAAFDPFGGATINPALEAVKKMKDTIHGAPVVKVEIPTVFHQSLEVLTKAVEREAPEVIIVVGQAGGRQEISVERVAINIDDARIPDNAGNQPVDQKIIPGGPEAYFSNLPIKRMTDGIRRSGVEAAVSNTAGTFVCNHIFYGLMHYIESRGLSARGGFIHVPLIPEQLRDRDELPAMELSDITRALEAAAAAAIFYKKDIKTSEGSLH